VRELDKQSLVSIGDVFDGLIEDWLKSHEINKDISDMTLDVSMETDVDEYMESKHVGSNPYLHPDVTRMAFLLKKRCNKELANKIKGMEVCDVLDFF
jgi:hypothetical protein